MNRLTAVSECKTDENTELTGGKPSEEMRAESLLENIPTTISEEYRK